MELYSVIGTVYNIGWDERLDNSYDTLHSTFFRSAQDSATPGQTSEEPLVIIKGLNSIRFSSSTISIRPIRLSTFPVRLLFAIMGIWQYIICLWLFFRWPLDPNPVSICHTVALV